MPYINVVQRLLPVRIVPKFPPERSGVNGRLAVVKFKHNNSTMKSIHFDWSNPSYGSSRYREIRLLVTIVLQPADQLVFHMLFATKSRLA